MALASKEILEGIVATQRKIEERFPGYSWLLDEPEIRDLLVKAANQEWSPQVFEANLTDTEWWKSRSQTERDWELLYNNDPAEAERQLQERLRQVRKLSGQMGVALDEEALRNISRASIREGWDDDQIRLSVDSRRRNKPDYRGAGFISATSDTAGIVDNYMLTVPQATIDDWTRRLMTGELTEEAFRGMLQTRAASQWPSLAEEIGRGVVPSDYFAPYVGLVSELTGVPAEQVRLQDPKWADIISHAGEGGEVRPMTLSEARTHIRGTEDFQRTTEAQNEAASFVDNFLAGMGKRR